MVSSLKFCPNCGTKLVPNDRFCADCGFDILSEGRRVQTPVGSSNQQISEPTAVEVRPEARQPLQGPRQQTAVGNVENLGRSTGNKKVFVILISLLAVLLLAGGGIYWWLTRGNDQGTGTSISSANQNKGIETTNTTTTTSGQQTTSNKAKLDLTQASTYLSEPGLKCTFYVNYPDGTVGIVERISGQAVPNEAVRVSEVEIGVDQGADFGFGFHYVERADGTYYILDQTPNEIMPVLKNNLAAGQTWKYQNEGGQIIWTVLDIGVKLDLGFTVFDDCLLVQEDNQMAEFQSITYYAPGRGSVKVINPSGTIEYYKMTAFEPIDLAQAKEKIIKWCPNYYDIKDDRTQ